MSITLGTFALTDFVDKLTTAWGNTLVMHLFTNPITPDKTTVAADLVEATFPGYAAQNITTWGAAILNASVQGESDAATVTWTAAAGSLGNQIWGYWVEDAGGTYLWAEPFGFPIDMSVSGASMGVFPVFELDTPI
jgi:hypothetical protein